MRFIITLFYLLNPLKHMVFFALSIQLHGSIIRDIVFLHSSWPWLRGHTGSILTAGGDGTCKVSTIDGRGLHQFQANHQVNTICPTPEPFNQGAEDGFYSVFIVCSMR